MEEATEEKTNFNDTLDFNAWQLTPQYAKKYSDIIGKDVPLSNIASKNEMEYVDLHLRTATYLNGISQKILVGYDFHIINEEGESITMYLEVDSIEEGLKIVGETKKLISVRKVYVNDPIMKKTCHNKLSRAYTRMSLSRGINGQAAKDLKTVRHEEHKTLRELTDRGGWNPFSKKKSNWSEYEKQKNN